MKFTDYQDTGDGIKSPLTDLQKYSKFWDRGKWDHYIAPHITGNVKGMTYIDMGCNAGLFLKYAQDLGFSRIIGIDINPDVVKRGIVYREKVGGKWDIRVGKMEEVLKDLPVADYMSFVNSHYYLLIKDWLDMLDILHKKTRYCILTATRKKKYFCLASSRERNMIQFFKSWELVSHIPQLPREDDPCPRSLSTFCFQSPSLERMPLNKLTRGHHMEGDFYTELEKGIHPLETSFYKSLRQRSRRATDEQLQQWMLDKVATYEDIKKNGIKEPIIVNKDNSVLDGNYRLKMLEFWGDETTIIRRVH